MADENRSRRLYHIPRLESSLMSADVATSRCPITSARQNGVCQDIESIIPTPAHRNRGTP
jgi:hypothetical protein